MSAWGRPNFPVKFFLDNEAGGSPAGLKREEEGIASLFKFCRSSF